MYTIAGIVVLIIILYILYPKYKNCCGKKREGFNTMASPNRVYKTFGTVLRSAPKVQTQAGKYKYTRPTKIRPIPTQFDATEIWKEFLSPIKDQKQCGNCWAQASIGVLADRIALATNNKVKLDLSASKMTSCGYLFVDETRKYGGPSELWKKRTDKKVVEKLLEELQDKAQCNGQSLYDAVKILFVYGTTTSKCVPYKGTDMLGKKYDVHDATVSKDIPLCFDLTGIDSDTCTDGVTAMLNYRAIDVYNISNIEQEIKLEIMRMGPILGGFQIFPDFLYEYDGNGIYTHPKKDQQPLGGHAIRIVGWGEAEQDGRTVKYWIIANSWGPEWGNKGFFKMEMFIKDCELEDNIIGFIPDLIEWGREDKKSTDIIDQDLVNLRNGKLLPEHYVDETTALMNTAIDKIKEGKLIGKIEPFVDVRDLPPYNNFWAMDRKSLNKSSSGSSLGKLFSYDRNDPASRKNRLRINIYLIIIIYSIVIYFTVLKD